jgi:hypothetical protein
MKRTQRDNASKPGTPSKRSVRTLDRRSLRAARGGNALAISVQIATPPAPGKEAQHNETLVRLP